MSSQQATGFATLDGTAPSFRGEGKPVTFEGLFKRKDPKLGRYLFELRTEDANRLYNEFTRPNDDKTAFAIEDSYWKIATAIGKLDKANLDAASLKKIDNLLVSYVGKPVVLTVTGAIYYYDDVTFKNKKREDTPSYTGYALSITNVVPTSSSAVVQSQIVTHNASSGSSNKKKKGASKKVPVFAPAAPPAMKRSLTRGSSAILLSDDEHNNSDDEDD